MLIVFAREGTGNLRKAAGRSITNFLPSHKSQIEVFGEKVAIF